VIEGSLSVGLEYPMGITVYDADDGESLIVSDALKNEVIYLWNIDSRNTNTGVCKKTCIHKLHYCSLRIHLFLLVLA